MDSVPNHTKCNIFGGVLWGINLVFTICILTTSLAACGSSSSQGSSGENPSETGAFTCKLFWPTHVPQSEGSQLRLKAVDCSAAGISTIRFSFYDENDKALTEDNWDCNQHSGTITGIATGENRKLICTAEDADNQILYRAIVTGITIEKDKIKDGGEIEMETYSSNLVRPELAAPADGAVVNGSPIILSWNRVAGTATYELSVSSQNDFSTIIFNGEVAAESYAYHDAVSAGTYYWRVRALDEEMNFSDWSESRSFRILQADTSPNAPAGVHVSQGDAFLSLSWDNVAGAEYYNIYWATTSQVSASQHDGIIENIVATSYLHTGLINGVTYFYVITAENIHGQSPVSVVVNGTPAETMLPLLEEENSFSQSGQTEYHEVTASAGQDLFVKLSYDSRQSYYLYVKFGSPPQNRNDFDTSSTTGNDELAVIQNTQSGTYYIMVYAFSHSANYSGDYNLTVSNSLPSLSLETLQSSSFSHSGQKHYYQIACHSGQDLFVKLELDSRQSYYLYLSYGTPPTRDDFDASSTTGEDELAVIHNTQAGIYYAMVYVFSHSANYSGEYTVSARSNFEELRVGFPIDSSFNSSQQKKFYQIDTAAGQNLYITLRYDSRQSYYLYAAYETPPTRNDYDFSSTNGDQELITIQNSQAGMYYIMVYVFSHSENYSGDYVITGSNSF